MSGLGYYRQYQSDSDTSESESDETSTRSSASSYTEGANFAALANMLLKPTFGGQDMTDLSGQIYYTKTDKYSLYNPLIDPLLLNDLSGTIIEKAPQRQEARSSSIRIDSIYRDKNVYPQPTQLRLTLPRVYKNIQNFQIIQIKLLSSFLYFRASKQNINISIHEQSRYLDTNKTILNIITNRIREGSYDINTLIQELTIQLNTTPIFYDFINGYADFAPGFQSTGDYSKNFNLPGDYYYDSLLNQYISDPTMYDIVTKYFDSIIDTTTTSYSPNQCKIAYYYPVLKEILLDNNYIGPTIDFNAADSTLLDPTDPLDDTPTSHCIYNFGGLNDNYVLSVILNNINSLDTYRLRHTFRYSLINKYNVSYATNNNIITINTASLNTSLVNLLNTQQLKYYNSNFGLYNLTQSNYDTLKLTNISYRKLLIDMYNFIQTQFATGFAVQFGTYSTDYYGDINNYIDLRYGSNANVFSSYSTALSNDPLNNNIITYSQSNPPYYWPQLALNPRTNYASGKNHTLFSGNRFNLQTDSIENYPLLQSNTFYTNRLLNSVDAVVNIDNTSYTVFKFNVPNRQTLTVESLPRPTKYRYPEYNSNYSTQLQNLFDNSYNFIFNTSNSLLVDPIINVQTLPGFNQGDSNFAIDLVSSKLLWGTTYAQITPADNRNFFRFITPYPDNSNSPAYNYNINITINPIDNLFPTDLNIFVYRDIGAFYADISSDDLETPYNYLYSNNIVSNTGAYTLSLNVYAGKIHYILFRSIGITPLLINYTLTPWFSNAQYTSLTNSTVNFNPLADPQKNLNNLLYARSYDTNYVQLPSYESLYQATPGSNALIPDITYTDIPMGYDTNNVSTDLTHYIRYIQNQPTQSFVPAAKFGVDPISQYVFRVQDGYNQSSQNYFYSNTSNKLYTANSLAIYNPTVVTIRTYSQVHYYATNYIPNTPNQPSLPTSYISAYTTPYNTSLFSNTLTGYNFDTQGNIQLGDGIYGLSLIPGEGTWNIQRYMFKSVFTESVWPSSNLYDYTSDPNLSIAYLGIFYTNVLGSNELQNIKLSNAITVLEFSKSRTYNSSNLDFGFGSDGGTYYEFINTSNVKSYLYGFTENSNSITTDINNGYTVLAFDINSNILPFVGLTGSLVPYPYYSDAVASNNYFGNTTSNGYNVIVPTTKANPDTSRGPPVGYNETQSQYEQSMPLGTNYLGYSIKTQLYNATMYTWSNLGFNPHKVYTDVNGYILTQDTEFRLYSYNSVGSDREFTYLNTLTEDAIFTGDINLVAVAANETTYAFLGFNSNGYIINTYNPESGVLATQNIYTIAGFNVQCQSFTYNNFGGHTLSYKGNISGSNSVLSVSVAPTATSNVLSDITDGSIIYFTYINGTTSNLQNFISYQHPKENTGKFYVAYYTSNVGITSFYKVDPTTTSVPNLASPGYAALIQGVATTYANILRVQCSNYFDAYAITRDPVEDIIYGFKNSVPTKFSELTSYSASTNLSLYDSNANFTTSTYGFSTNVKVLTAGNAAGLWGLDNNGTLYGNRGIASELARRITFAYQLFYPTQRVLYNQISKEVNTMLDLSGLMYPEFAHTQLFLYTSDLSFNTDISGTSSFAPWGNESNFYISDTHYSGYYFNAYSKLPLQSSDTPYYLAVRNYSPTEKSQVYMRFSLKSRYDFGYARIIDISNEIQLSSSNASNFNPNYASALKSFNSNFIFTSKTFGASDISYGSNISNCAGFGDFMKYYIATYNTYTSNVQIINTIQSNVNASMSNFISYDLQNIIPATATKRQNFTAPLLFSIKWRSSLSLQYLALDDSWGLGWNLGYPKLDTDYSVIHTGTSLFRILDDYINLRLNTEFNFNSIDVTAAENLASTRDSTGQTSAYHGQLLIAQFGYFSQTMLMNPITFNPPLASMGTFSAGWYDTDGTVIDNNDCEWSAFIQITELVNVAS